MTRCPLCGGTGWALDANNAGLTGDPVQLELIPCPYPECDRAETPAIASLVFKGGAELRAVHRHPRHGWIMSVTR